MIILVRLARGSFELYDKELNTCEGWQVSSPVQSWLSKKHDRVKDV